MREQAKSITEQLTKAHRVIVKNFLQYRTSSDRLIRERDELRNNWIIYEKAYCMKTPVCETEFAMDERSPLQLYDCLVPRLREHRKLHIPFELYTDKQMLEDLKAKKQIMELQS